MNLEQYEYKANSSHLDFEFESIGPKGTIKKVVRYCPQNANGVTYFNLGFGDLNEATNEIDDLSTSNNQDKDKILATVAATLIEFISYFPDALVFATGSTPARTRLYQMGIAGNWVAINAIFQVFGFINNYWEDFKPYVNYSAFLVSRK